MSDGIPPRDLTLADAIAVLTVNCLEAVPAGTPVAGALVAITFPTPTGNETRLSFTTHSQLATPDSVVLRTIAAAILERAADAAKAEEPT